MAFSSRLGISLTRSSGARAASSLLALSLLALSLLVARPAPLSGQGHGIEMATSGESKWRWKEGGVLRVCADPDNLPFSNRKEEGFENRIAALLAQELRDSLAYVWWPQRRGFVRNTLRARECDVLLGVPGGFDPVLETRPYYRSTYSLVYPTARTPVLQSLDDPRLRQLRVGVNLIGEDYTHTPPVHALLKRGISANVTGFSTFYGEEHHPGEIIDSLASGNIDVAIVWGPLAGYFAKRSPVPLTIVPLPDDSTSALPFAFDVALGVRRADKELRSRLDTILDRRRPDIERILREYGVPTVTRPQLAERPASDAGARKAPVLSQGMAVGEQATSKKDSATRTASITRKKASQPATSARRKTPAATGAVKKDTTRRASGPDKLAVTQSEYDGWKVFAVNCTRCHGEDAIGSSIAPSLVKSLQGAVTHPVFVQTVTEGRVAKGMPAWGPLLTPTQIENVYAYVKARSDGRLATGRPHVQPGR
jgi:quinoprotein dehydrogenase-associated probable ABC transporter substrate-binding protein